MASRTIIKIDESLCNGCGACVKGCHEGALQLIDGKARMISDLYCDGLGACIGECPVGAIELEEREAEPYNEVAVLERIVPKGKATVRAHLLHLKAHHETGFLTEGLNYLKAHQIEIDMNGLTHDNISGGKEHQTSGCPGSRSFSFAPVPPKQQHTSEVTSQLRQWPVQLHLLNPEANYFHQADVLIAADCTAFAYSDFHNRFLRNHTLAIACPKLDSNKEVYVSKIINMIEQAQVNTLTVVIMEVPCCGGLLQLVKMAAEQATRKVPVKRVVIGVQGEVLEENWI